MIEVARQAYPDRDTLMRDLAELVADQLRARPCHARAARRWRCRAAPRRGRSSRRCREADLAWEDVRVLPTDERMVSRDQPALERAADPRDAAAGTAPPRRSFVALLRADRSAR